MRGQLWGRAAIIGALAGVGLAAGAWAGMDAAAQIGIPYSALTAKSLRADGRDHPAAPIGERGDLAPIAPPAGTIWGQDIGRDERAFFAPDDTAREHRPAVRVHHNARDQDLQMIPSEPRPNVIEDSTEDGWVDPPEPMGDRPGEQGPAGMRETDASRD